MVMINTSYTYSASVPPSTVAYTRARYTYNVTPRGKEGWLKVEKKGVKQVIRAKTFFPFPFPLPFPFFKLSYYSKAWISSCITPPTRSGSARLPAASTRSHPRPCLPTYKPTINPRPRPAPDGSPAPRPACRPGSHVSEVTSLIASSSRRVLRATLRMAPA
jgi:hypothetical protein